MPLGGVLRASFAPLSLMLTRFTFQCNPRRNSQRRSAQCKPQFLELLLNSGGGLVIEEPLICI